jgi:molybdopterin synthase catalytic subunit
VTSTQPSIRVTVGEAPIDPSSVLADVASDDSGATVLFLGTVRSHSEGKTGITHLDYEVYPEMVEEKIAEIAGEARARWPILSVAIEHRSGVVATGEASVAVCVSAPHRAEAFEAAQYLIDELKTRAPIWKKEHWPGGSEWSRGS